MSKILSGYSYILGFRKWLENNNKEIDWFDIQNRYDLYNEWFYSMQKCDEVGYCTETKSCGRRPKKENL